MEEREFLTLADAELGRIEVALERLVDALDFDYELRPGGIIEIELDDGSKIIVNRHAAAREIWVAARSGGFHFKPPGDGGTMDMADAAWRATRDDARLQDVLSRCLSEQARQPVALDW